MASAFKIESGVPLPETRGGSQKYPFAQMQVGDSFEIPERSERTRNRLHAAATLAGRRHGSKFSTRYTESGVRCWRIA